MAKNPRDKIPKEKKENRKRMKGKERERERERKRERKLRTVGGSEGRGKRTERSRRENSLKCSQRSTGSVPSSQEKKTKGKKGENLKIP